MEETGELKAGHPPAQKVGGMRVVQHKQKEEKIEASPSKMTEEDREEFGEDLPLKAASVSNLFFTGLNLLHFKNVLHILQSVMVSGAKTTEESSFPTDAVKSFHEKPMPTHDKGASNKPKVIQQPRK